MLETLEKQAKADNHENEADDDLPEVRQTPADHKDLEDEKKNHNRKHVDSAACDKLQHIQDQVHSRTVPVDEHE